MNDNPDNYNANQPFDPGFGLGSQDERRHEGDAQHEAPRNHHNREKAWEHRNERREENENLAVQVAEMNASTWQGGVSDRERQPVDFDADHDRFEDEGGGHQQFMPASREVDNFICCA